MAITNFTLLRILQLLPQIYRLSPNCTNTSNSVLQSANINCHWVLFWLSLNPDSIGASISQLAFLYLRKMFTKKVLLTVTAFDFGGHIAFNSRRRVGCCVSQGPSIPLQSERQHHIKPWSPWWSFISSSSGLGDWDFAPKQSLKDQCLIYEGVKIRSNSWITFHICINIDPTESGFYLPPMKLTLPLNCCTPSCNLSVEWAI